MANYHNSTVEACSFCNRGKGKVTILIGSAVQPSACICEDCSANTLATFQRMHELRGEALKISLEALTVEGKRDADGNCNCPNCMYERLLEADSILQDIEKTALALRDEEPMAVNHSGTSTVQ